MSEAAPSGPIVAMRSGGLGSNRFEAAMCATSGVSTYVTEEPWELGHAGEFITAECHMTRSPNHKVHNYTLCAHYVGAPNPIYDVVTYTIAYC